MHVIHVRNVQQALPEGLRHLAVDGILRDSRNGKVLVSPGPVTTQYDKPTERVLFWAKRDANPFLHLFESLWMLAGRDDVGFVGQFAKNMYSFSDDGETLHGAYGHRWRFAFRRDGKPLDQLNIVVNQLRANPDDRRCVIQMWSAPADLGLQGKDFPCNTHIYVSRNKDGALDMTVCCRSNDIIWGAYGANAVHFSVLQEFLAAAVGCPVGRYWQISNNFHAYLKTFEPLRELADEVNDGHKSWPNDPYSLGMCSPFPLVSTDIREWQQDLLMFMDHGGIVGLRDPFFRRVVTPMWNAHAAYAKKSDPNRYDTALEIIDQCKASDWRVACIEWLTTRKIKHELKLAQAA